MSSTGTKKDPHQEGRDAANKTGPSRNPYTRGSEDWGDWLNGYVAVTNKAKRKVVLLSLELVVDTDTGQLCMDYSQVDQSKFRETMDEKMPDYEHTPDIQDTLLFYRERFERLLDVDY